MRIRKIIKFSAIALLGVVSVAAHAQLSSIRWYDKTPGPGIENWGYSRPQGCHPDIGYLKPLASKIAKEWFAGGSVESVINITPNEFTSGRFADGLRNEKKQGAGPARLQNDVDRLGEVFRETVFSDAGSVSKLTSGSDMPGSEVVSKIQRFELVGRNCINPGGALNGATCGVAAKLFTLTANYERFVQISCHLGFGIPKHQSVATVSNSVTGRDSTSNSGNRNTNDLFATSTSPDDRRQRDERLAQSEGRYRDQQAAYDKAHQNKPKKNKQKMEAHECLVKSPIGRRSVYNKCSFDVEVSFCMEKPDQKAFETNFFEDAWARDCDKGKGGMWVVSAGKHLSGNYTGEKFHWFACKKPAIPHAKWSPSARELQGYCD